MGPACGDSLPALIVVIRGGHSETSWGRMQEACVLPQSCEPRHSSLEWRESVGGVFGGVCEKCDALCSGWEQACQPEMTALCFLGFYWVDAHSSINLGQ